MDEQDNPIGDEAASPAKKTRGKTGAKRTRARADAGIASEVEAIVAQVAEAGNSSAPAVDSAGEAAPRPRRGRTRKAKPAAEAGGDSAPASETPDLFQPEDGAPLGGGAEPFRASFGPEDDAPASESGAGESAQPRAVFVPQGREPSSSSDEAGESAAAEGAPENASAGEGGAPGSGGGEQNGGGQGRRDDRKSWWERKKEKKRQKWLERQQNGGHAPQGGGQGGNGGGGGQSSHGGEQGRGGGRPERERAPAQPPPPSLQGPQGGLPDVSRFSDLAALDASAEAAAKDTSPLDLGELHALGAGDIAQRLRLLGESVAGMPPRRMLVEQLFAWAAREKRTLREVGLLDLTDTGHGFVVHRGNSYRLHPESTYVPAALVKRHGLRRGQEVEVLALPPQAGERCPAAVSIIKVMGTTPELAREVTAFEELTPYYPTKRILVEAPEIHKDISMRAVDLLTPVGFGQRGLIVAPPRTGKTVLLQNIANSISNNYPEATLLLLLIDERPEEVTDFKRHTRGEVVSSTFDETPESHVHAAEMVIEKARRLVEMGKHVVILLDSITRLARAYNALAGNSGKIMSGGIEANALQRPKRFFGSARNIEGGGSLTILGTALIDTNSRMDEVIFEEFKGTGNMELHLDRGLSDKRIFPAINIDRSGTRKEELIYHPDEMLRVYGLRRAMQGIPPVEAMDMFIQRLKKTRTNTEFLLSLNR